MLRKVFATAAVASIAALSIAMPKHGGNELSVRQNHGDYYDIWHQAVPPATKAPPAMKYPPQGAAVPNTYKGARCFCPNGQAGVLTNGKCACAPLPAGRLAYVPLSKKSEETGDAPAESTEALDEYRDLEERRVKCDSKTTCPYMQHAVGLDGVCMCVRRRSKEKRDTAESTIPDEQPYRPKAPCGVEINCPYLQHAVRQNGACTCVPMHTRKKRDTAQSTIPEEQHQQLPAPKVICGSNISCPTLSRAVRRDGVCTCISLGSKKKRSIVTRGQRPDGYQHGHIKNCDWMTCPRPKGDFYKKMMRSTAESALEERELSCSFNINCPYLSYAVRQNDVCVCISSPSKEKRVSATLGDLDHGDEDRDIPGYDTGNGSSD